MHEIRSSGARTVADVLDLLPGVTITRDIAGFYRPGIRGVRADPEALVQLNGHPINDPYDGRAMLELPAFNLDGRLSRRMTRSRVDRQGAGFFGSATGA